MDDRVVLGLLQRIPLFAAVPTAELLPVAAAARSQSKKKRVRIFDEGSAADSCYVIVSGRAKVVIAGRAGAEIILGTVEPGELVGEIALLDGAPRSAGLVALEDCQLIRIPGASFEALRSNRAFEDALVARLALMLRRSTEQLRAIHTYSSNERVAWCLARLAARSGARQGSTITISPRPPHHELADMTGCSRETVTRVLVHLRRLKRVTWNRDVLIIDEPAFRHYLEAERVAATSPQTFLI